MSVGALSTTEQYLSTADAYYVDENYTDAIDAYAAALVVVRDDETNIPESVYKCRILSHRSGAFYHLGRYQEALDDAQAAGSGLRSLLVLVGPTTPTTASGAVWLLPGESEACARKEGLAAFQLQHYKVAQEAFETAAQLAGLNQRDGTAYHDWIRQCEQQQQQQPLVRETHPKDEASSPPSFAQSSSSSSSKRALISPDSSTTGSPATTTTTTTTTTTKVAAAATVRSMSTTATPAPRYQYYQNDTFMTVCILEPNVQASDLTVTMEAKRLTVVLKKEGMDFTVIAGALYEQVNVEQSKVQIKTEKVLIKLRKNTFAYEWRELLTKETKKPPPPPSVPMEEDKDIPKLDASVPRPYASSRDWNTIERKLKAEEENEKPQGEDAMNKLFEQIYSKADEDTRRAMIKSYQTSGGTVLSTNWQEVAAKDYEKERTAPKVRSGCAFVTSCTQVSKKIQSFCSRWKYCSIWRQYILGARMEDVGR
jgi:suppressor of G2 allele of SKP1